MTADLRRTAILLATLPVFACGQDPVAPIGDTPDVATAPHVLALSTYGASVGTLVEVYGENFGAIDGSVANLLFEGHFLHNDGTVETVSSIQDARIVDKSTMRWTSYGPYANPFTTSGSGIGTFEGTVAALITEPDGTAHADPQPIDVRFDVKPSLLVRGFQPLTASCNGNVLRGIGGASYRVEVEAIGFEPETITYTLAAPGILEFPTSVRHLTTDKIDSVGDRGNFKLPQVPDGIPSYGAILTAQARDADGNLYSNAFGFTVHRPIGVFYNGNIEVGEVLEPTPVSGCIPGGVNGRQVQYTESQAETRSRSYGVSWNQSWLASHTVASGSSETVGLSERNGVGFSTTDGQSFNWSLGGEVGGTFGLDKLVSLGVKTSAEVGGERSRQTSNSVNRETGVNASSTTTETESVSQSAGGGVGEQFAWNVSSSQVISQGFGGQVIAGTFGVFYRQTLRLTRRAALVAYNQCGYATVVGEVDFTDWTWSPDLAIGNSCPPLPQSNLPSAQCYTPPCAGQ